MCAIKPVKTLLKGYPVGDVSAAELSHLSESFKPKRERARKPVGTVDRSREKRRLRGLSAKQKLLGDGILLQAVDRVKEEARDRKCKYLREFDTIYEHGYRTYQTRWDALADIVEPMLARLDIATLALGWLDADGSFHLNRQRGLSEDSTCTQEWTVSRTLTALEQAKYVRRKMRRIFYNGKKWITRVTIHVRPRFFIHLGLAHLLAPLRTKMRSKRDAHLAQVGIKMLQQQTQDLAQAHERKESHKRAQDVRKAAERKQQTYKHEDYTRRYNELSVDFALNNPHLKGRQRAEAFVKAHPYYAVHPSALP